MPDLVRNEYSAASVLKSPASFSRPYRAPEIAKWNHVFNAASKVVRKSTSLEQYAMRAYDLITAFMGDRKTTQDPQRLLRNLANIMMEKPAIVQEVYLQLVKQLTNNPHIESFCRGWLLMVFICSAFRPRPESFLDQLTLFINNADGPETTFLLYGGRQKVEKEDILPVNKYASQCRIIVAAARDKFAHTRATHSINTDDALRTRLSDLEALTLKSDFHKLPPTPRKGDANYLGPDKDSTSVPGTPAKRGSMASIQGDTESKFPDRTCIDRH
jgi:hypothetical protein